jgi:glycosyltransferase A (GT-A) superfamily protein (DUF2064 family)
MTPLLSPEVAAAFYREMLLDVLDESARACVALDLEGVLSVSPKVAMHDLAGLAPKNFRVVAQSGPDLGARMAHEVARALATGAARVVLRGSDNPALGTGEIAALDRALDTVDLAASPDLDGGYGAIGLRVAAREVFDHPMSTDEVLRETLERASAAGLTSATAEGCFDLDTVDDLRHLAEARPGLPADRCPRTLAFADQHGLWPMAN